jgi:DNA-directed RNA polymerase subunit RPC12/RpoP
LEVAWLKRIREKLRNFFIGRYGIDELEKALFGLYFILYFLGILLKNRVLLFISFAVVVVFFYRSLSRQIYARSEENSRFMRYIKLWKMKYEYRKTARIYLCPQCGKLIRVPKGKKKIQITCPNCGHSIIRYT